MRRSPSSDNPFLSHAGGAPAPAVEADTERFEAAYRELSHARALYDTLLGDPNAVPSLALASARLDRARRMMAVARTAA